MKRCSVSLIIREMQIKTMRHYPTPIMTSITKSANSSIGQGVEERQLPYSVNRRQLGAVTRKTVWSFLKKLKLERLYDPANPLLGIYLEKTKKLKALI